jgi:shikimate kinase
MLISLVGYRGTGKTTIGHLLAERLGWHCIDSDTEIVSLTGQSIQQIFAENGEEKFRDYESDVIRDLVRRHKVVLALGGGAVLRPENQQLVTVAGPVVWLTASPETIHRRISDDPVSTSQRPKLTSSGGIEEIRQLLETRHPVYQACADCTIATDDRAPREIVDEILNTLDILPQSL